MQPYAPPPNRPPSTAGSVLKVIAIVVLCIGAILVGLVWWFLNGVEKENQKYAAEQKAAADEKARVSVSARVEKKCKADFPIGVAIENRSSAKTVKQVVFSIEVYEEGRSTNLVNELGFPGFRNSDVVLGPGEATDLCYAMPPLSRRPQGPWTYRLKKEDVTFFEPGEFVPRAPSSVP